MPVSRPCIDWKSIEGAFHKAERFHLQRDKDDLFHCAVPNCEHDRFVSNEVVESMLKQNIRGTYILMLIQKFETMNERSLMVLMRGNRSSHREVKQ